MLKQPLWLVYGGLAAVGNGFSSVIFHASETQFGRIFDKVWVNFSTTYMVFYTFCDMILEDLNQIWPGLGDELSAPLLFL